MAELDEANAEQHETVQVIPLHRTSADAVQRALAAFGGEAVQVNPTSAAGNNAPEFFAVRGRQGPAE